MTLGFSFLALSIASLVQATPPDDDDERRTKVYDFSDSFAPAPAAEFGATPGGAQDIRYFRDRVAAGEIPLPEVFTPEGLFSEHDLPLATGLGCTQTFCAEARAMAAEIGGQADVEFLAQLGFSSGLDPRTFQRAPLNLVAVVDRSGSMSGRPLELVQASLTTVVDQLDPDDRFSLVGYESTPYVMLEPTSIKHRKDIDAAIAGLVSGGSTSMERGLAVGFELAERSAKKLRFDGTTRVMLFTDERPNVGRTDAGSFMTMAREASNKGIGLTTIGVSTHFGAELAQQISSVRGGNLFYFADIETMQQTFADEFDTMVTELAYDLNLHVTPAPGTKIVGVYGVPGSALVWQGDTIVLDVETIFLSRRKGAIYIGLRRDGDPNLPPAKFARGDVLGQVALAYEDAKDGKTHQAHAALALVEREHAGPGLTRGELLVDEATTLRRASMLHHEDNDQERAYRLVRALHARLMQANDATLQGRSTWLGCSPTRSRRRRGTRGRAARGRGSTPSPGCRRARELAQAVTCTPFQNATRS